MQINDKMNRYSLKFQDKELEKSFLKWYYKKIIKQVRYAIFFAIIAFIVFSIPDFSLKENKYLFMILRFCIVLPFLVGAGLFSYSKHFERVGQFLISFFLLFAGIFALFMSFSEIPKISIHFLGFGVILIVGYFLLELRFIFTIITEILLLLLFFTWGLSISFIHYSEIIFDIFKFFGFFYVILNLFGIISTYSREKLQRNSFVQEKKIIENNIVIIEQKDKIEELLHNMLPIQIVKEYNETGFSKPVLNENATIVFTDFVSFSKFAEETDPNVVVDNLDKIFSKFDDIVKSKNLEKLKTIGDSYMFAGGLFYGTNQLEESLEACFEMIEYISSSQREFIETTGYEWKIRIGIHSGPVVTGLIGKWRFLYDTWGNTVNIASRLEGASETNKINTSNNVYNLLADKNKYNFEYRGALPIKNMNPIEMYFVEKR
jgi:class 3 adenylate cyclase